MSVHPVSQPDIAAMAANARKAALKLAAFSDELRRKPLLAAADAIEKRAAEILEANARDCAAATRLVEQGKLSRALFKRLQTSERGVAQMAKQVREVAALDDPLGRELAVTALDDDLILRRVSCPLGVVAVIFEARPEVIPQIASLALRTGNAILLKGGSEAENTNTILVKIWRDAISAFPEVPVDSINLLHTREDVNQLLTLDTMIDLIIPRGSNAFVQHIMQHSRIPVLGHGEGICHVYVDRAADLNKAVAICYDAKVQYPAVCNAAETLLVHEDVAGKFLPEMIERYAEAGVEVRGCPRTIAAYKGRRQLVPATEDDWRTEYSDLIISIKLVSSAEEAIEHVNRWGSKHTDAIVTEDRNTAEEFMDRVDSASVYHNVSTRFADGFRYGFGAEVGIATGKLHARGPVGLEGLTTYKYKLSGNGHTVAGYVSGEKKFKHRSLK
jgi:glutamate-5-semialdehyde dehydrogenase